MNIEAEVWLPIPLYQGYEASNIGRVRNAETGRIKQPSPLRKKHYLSVNLQRGGRENKRVFYVHELVAVAFLGVRPRGLVIDHVDGNKYNNRLDNLEYVTQAENVRRHHARMRRLAIARRQFERAAEMAIAV